MSSKAHDHWICQNEVKDLGNRIAAEYPVPNKLFPLLKAAAVRGEPDCGIHVLTRLPHPAEVTPDPERVGRDFQSLHLATPDGDPHTTISWWT